MPPSNSRSLEGGVVKSGRKGSKSRTGCQTCKVKRLKCDETKPFCSNCTKRGLECPGYKQVLRWSTKYEATSADAPPQNVVHPSLNFQFSVIDPSSFGDVEAEEDGATSTLNEQPSDSQAVNAAAQPTTSVLVLNQSPTAEPLFDDTFQVETDYWQVDLPDLSSLGETEESSLVPFEHSRDHEDQNDVADYEVQRTTGPSTNSSTSGPNSAQWKALLRSYYRMSSPTLPRSLQNEASALVEHYFRDVCVIFSCFDSAMNPFRTVIAKLWDNSSSIFFAIQSMAAAHLANYIPQMRITGLNMQQKAYECLQQELQLASINQAMDDKLILAVLLLGMSAGWHDSSDLGFAHLAAARSLIQTRLARDDYLKEPDSTRNDQFYGEALIYWEMIMSFVLQETFVPGMERRLRTTILPEPTPQKKVFPHPWTGIAPRVQMLFAEVGRLVRHYCTMKATIFDSSAPPFDMDAIVLAAKDLEEQLLDISLPAPEDLVDVQDERTGKSDFVWLAEANKCAALLTIYRVFPEILFERLNSANSGDLPTTFSMLDSNYQYGYGYDKPFSLTSWLTSLAIYTLDVLAKIPMSSGTRPIQVIMLVTSAAELRLSGPSLSSPELSESTSFDLRVAQARGFATARLNELCSRLASKPIFIIIKLVREVWRRNDAGEDVFWMDVMTANGWETTMG